MHVQANHAHVSVPVVCAGSGEEHVPPPVATSEELSPNQGASAAGTRVMLCLVKPPCGRVSWLHNAEAALGVLVWCKVAVAAECEHVTCVFVNDFRDQDGEQFSGFISRLGRGRLHSPLVSLAKKLSIGGVCNEAVICLTHS